MVENFFKLILYWEAQHNWSTQVFVFVLEILFSFCFDKNETWNNIEKRKEKVKPKFSSQIPNDRNTHKKKNHRINETCGCFASTRLYEKK
jgi:hypothetical protein